MTVKWIEFCCFSKQTRGRGSAKRPQILVRLGDGNFQGGLYCLVLFFWATSTWGAKRTGGWHFDNLSSFECVNWRIICLGVFLLWIMHSKGWRIEIPESFVGAYGRKVFFVDDCLQILSIFYVVCCLLMLFIKICSYNNISFERKI